MTPSTHESRCGYVYALYNDDDMPCDHPATDHPDDVPYPHHEFQARQPETAVRPVLLVQATIDNDMSGLHEAIKDQAVEDLEFEMENPDFTSPVEQPERTACRHGLPSGGYCGIGQEIHDRHITDHKWTPALRGPCVTCGAANIVHHWAAYNDHEYVEPEAMCTACGATTDSPTDGDGTCYLSGHRVELPAAALSAAAGAPDDGTSTGA